jgi:lipoyl(octanoyl) transferase
VRSLVRVRALGLRGYREVWEAMRSFTDARLSEAPDEIWLTEHPRVFTLGVRGTTAQILDAGDIPIVAVDRGGQVTYHGPGQIVCYVLLDLHRLGLGVRQLVTALERAVLGLLAARAIAAEIRPGAPGVYVGGRKIAALGLRVRRGKCYHGLSLNVAMDLSPFRHIHPCGDPNLEVTQLADLGGPTDLWKVGEDLVQELAGLLRLDARWV